MRVGVDGFADLAGAPDAGCGQYFDLTKVEQRRSRGSANALLTAFLKSFSISVAAAKRPVKSLFFGQRFCCRPEGHYHHQ